MAKVKVKEGVAPITYKVTLTEEEAILILMLVGDTSGGNGSSHDFAYNIFKAFYDVLSEKDKYIQPSYDIDYSFGNPHIKPKGTK